MNNMKLMTVVLSILALLTLPIVGITPFLRLPQADAQTTIISDVRVETNPRTVNAGDTLIIGPNGSLELRKLTNYGSIIVQGYLSAPNEDARIDNYGLILVLGVFYASEDGIVGDNSRSGGDVFNQKSGIINIDSGAIASMNHLTNEGIINNYGNFGVGSGYTSSTTTNTASGVINNNAGKLDVGAGWPGESTATLANHGKLNNNANALLTITQGGDLTRPRAIVDNFGNAANLGTVENENGGMWKQECGAVFNNQGTFTGNQPVNVCGGAFPVTHMSDTTTGDSRQLYSSLSIRVEHVTSTSQLIGDKIDQITVRLAKVGTPTGTTAIGVFDAAGNLKKLFGAKDVSTISTSNTDYTFSLSGSELYTIVSGDKIGIQYTGGSSTNYVKVVTDTNTADPFDGTKSYRQWFTGGAFQSATAEDMYMILKQTHG